MNKYRKKNEKQLKKNHDNMMITANIFIKKFLFRELRRIHLENQFHNKIVSRWG